MPDTINQIHQKLKQIRDDQSLSKPRRLELLAEAIESAEYQHNQLDREIYDETNAPNKPPTRTES